MKKSLFLLLLLSVLGVSSLYSQTQYVYLNNGSVLKGRILYSDNPNEIKIRSSGNIFVYNRQYIDSVTSKKVKPSTVGIPLDFKNFFRIGVDVLVGNKSNEEVAPAVFQASFNHTVYDNISVGVGSGMEYYKETTFLPAFANIEYRFRNTRFSPFVYLKCGYLFAANESIQKNTQIYYGYESSIAPWPSYRELELHPFGGVLINPGIGFNVMISDYFGFFFGVGYRYHKIGFTGDDGYSIDYQYNRLSINIGVLFQ